MSGVFLQCRRTLVILRQNTAVNNEKGIFCKILDNYQKFRKDVKNEVTEGEEPKRS
ncbi:uncharacterized protein LOC110190611 isoform X2 [Drosophila serrata]|uniref:uncharacterized protein LOC110190611 isoform X2 n=1 Tax=Drosophila serrata TaxID=7274 RepID=UPI000A1CFE29|nr:uncharacterized protein LOC110190611 isoform X2 [Drosophila serrata]KAH8378550.1 hypothetical protein KR200_005203 [Drosophila serrata]